jgi:hypothetical protein
MATLQPSGFVKTRRLEGSSRCARSEDVAYYRVMPELSRFFGIIIRMFSEAGMSHHVAHFHAYTQDETAVFSSCCMLDAPPSPSSL